MNQKTETLTLAAAMDVLARDIQSDDGVANAAIAEAAQRLRELEWELARHILSTRTHYDRADSVRLDHLIRSARRGDTHCWIEIGVPHGMDARAAIDADILSPNTTDRSENPAAQGVGSIDLFDRCVRRKVRSTGMLLIKCRLGLWLVEGPDHAFVESSAQHYWMKYYADGEYAQLLTNIKDEATAARKTHAKTKERHPVEFENAELGDEG